MEGDILSTLRLNLLFTDIIDIVLTFTVSIVYCMYYNETSTLLSFFKSPLSVVV